MNEALPCLVCGKRLRRDIDDYEVQPRDGVIVTSRGNDGSRVFDPVVSGDVLYMNVCDDCLVRAGDQGRVRAGVDAVPVMTDAVVDAEGRIMRAITGWKTVDRPLINWDRTIPNDDTRVFMSVDEIIEAIDAGDERYRWNLQREHYVAMLAELDGTDDR